MRYRPDSKEVAAWWVVGLSLLALGAGAIVLSSGHDEWGALLGLVWMVICGSMAGFASDYLYYRRDIRQHPERDHGGLRRWCCCCWGPALVYVGLAAAVLHMMLRFL